jgi:hypothetical protein
MATNVTAVEVARELGVTLDHIYKQLRAGRLEGAVKEQGKWKVPAQTLKSKLLHKGQTGRDQA